MDSYSNRASSLFTTFTTVLFTFALLSHVTYYFTAPSPSATLKVSGTSITDFSEYKQYKADQLKFDFEVSYDLSSEFNWNVNQLYLYVVASYETEKNKRNEVVVFDKIIRDKADYKSSSSLQKIKSKYVLRDEYKGLLAGKKLQLSVRYQVMPIFGLLRNKDIPLSTSSRATLEVPDNYLSKK